jgi:S1-C subfamily serine protease
VSDCTPLGPDEIRTLHPDQPLYVCDSTAYGDGAETPKYDVLQLFKQASPNVVQVDSTHVIKPSPGIESITEPPTVIRQGSGTVVQFPDGKRRVVMANHEVDGMDKTVATINGEQHTLRLEARDPGKDIAIFQFENENAALPAGLKIGSAPSLDHQYMLVGYPEGASEPFMSLGNFEKMRQLPSLANIPKLKPYEPLAQVTARSEHRESGGALIAEDGTYSGFVIGRWNGGAGALVVSADEILPVLKLAR